MGNDIFEIRANVCDLIAAAQAMLAPLAAQLRAGTLDEYAQARWLLERLARMLDAHVEELSEHLHRLGGSTAPNRGTEQTLAADLMNAAAPALNAGSVAHLLRNYYTALSLIHAGALMLETNARAHWYSSTAAMATRHREEIATLLGSIRELLPAAIKEEVTQRRVAGEV